MIRDQLGVNVREHYIDEAYENERDLFVSVKNSFPSDFQTYLDTFIAYNYDSICLPEIILENLMSSNLTMALANNFAANLPRLTLSKPSQGRLP